MRKAYLNHGRWIADCAKCGGAELTTAEFCQVCNQAHPIQQFHCQNHTCHARDEVKMPTNLAAIEAVVRFRPLENQNWLPGESVASLKLENDEHQVPVE